MMNWALILVLSIEPTAWKLRAEVTSALRWFSEDENSQTVDEAIALLWRVELAYRSGRWRFVTNLNGRRDRLDPERNLNNLTEAYVATRFGSSNIEVGYQALNWTATEAFHPADVINSRHWDSDLEKPERLGELMAVFSARRPWGRLSFFWLPRFAAPKFPAPSVRTSFTGDLAVLPGVHVDSDGIMHHSQWVNQGGFRFQRYLNGIDFSIYALNHIDRLHPDYKLVVDPTLSEDYRIRPNYFRVRDFGLTAQWVQGPWIGKLESVYKNFVDSRAPGAQSKDHGQTALGFEYGFNDWRRRRATLLMEAQFLWATSDPLRTQLSVFQRDVLLGWRLDWNDIFAKTLLVTWVFDLQNQSEWLANMSYRQRLNDHWSVRAGLRLFQGSSTSEHSGLAPLDQADHATFELSFHF